MNEKQTIRRQYVGRGLKKLSDEELFETPSGTTFSKKHLPKTPYDTLCVFLKSKKTDTEEQVVINTNSKGEEIKFEEFQKYTIKKILNKKDSLTVVPTGGGKSYCYQIPAMHLRGTTIVISPLVSLIEDQVKTLKGKNYPGYDHFPVACITSQFLCGVDSDEFYYYNKKKSNEGTETEEAEDTDGTDETEKKKETKESEITIRKILSAAYEGKCKLLYITPERLLSAKFVLFARKANISMIAVDEAHCVSLWGHEFRKSYLKISTFINKIGYRPVIAAFTATATKPVRDDIIKYLKLKGREENANESNLVKREELIFSVEHFNSDMEDPNEKTAETEEKKRKYIVAYIKNHPDVQGYIYCSTAKSVNKLYEYLKEKGISCTRYYAALDTNIKAAKKGKASSKSFKFDDGESKENNFDDFKKQNTNVMITTNALGMGIDVRDVRYVIHYNMPLCLENYYQEAGRAGRNALKGVEYNCILLYSEGDRGICETLIKSTTGGLFGSDKEKREKIGTSRLDEMEKYAKRGADMESDALQDYIIEYFNTYDPSKEENEEQTEKKAKSQNKGRSKYSDIRLPDMLLVNRTKIAHELRAGRMSATEHPLVVGSKKVKPKDGDKKDDYEIIKKTVKYKVTAIEGKTEENRITYFDMMVADAVYTLMFYGVPTIFPRHVMMLLSGNENITLQAKKKENIEKSIEKMMNLYICINMTDSVNYTFEYGIKKGGGEIEIIKGWFLPLKKNSGNGQTKKVRGYGYDKGALPPLYRYAEMMEQVFTCRFKLLNLNAENPKKMQPDSKQEQVSEPKSAHGPSTDNYMERRINIIKFFLPEQKRDNKEYKNKNKKDGNKKSAEPKPGQQKYHSYDTKDLGSPGNPLLPENFMATEENLALLHYLAFRIDIIQRLYEKERRGKKAHSASPVIRFDTIINTLDINLGKNEYYRRRKADELWKWIVFILKHFISVGYIKDYELIITNKPKNEIY